MHEYICSVVGYFVLIDAIFLSLCRSYYFQLDDYRISKSTARRDNLHVHVSDVLRVRRSCQLQLDGFRYIRATHRVSVTQSVVYWTYHMYISVVLVLRYISQRCNSVWL